MPIAMQVCILGSGLLQFVICAAAKSKSAQKWLPLASGLSVLLFALHDASKLHFLDFLGFAGVLFTWALCVSLFFGSMLGWGAYRLLRP